MEGGANPKKMARSKRASSQRSKAKHSKHGGHGGVVSAAAARERTLSEDLLPSNWERYGDESGSEEDLGPLAEGEVRPKSKGADYRELLTSDVPQLFEETPEMEGLTAMLLENGLGLWDWDSSYLEPASVSSERQAARDASALLTVDMKLLGQSLASLSLAQRLFLEDDLFPMQKQAEDRMESIDTSTRASDSEGPASSMKDGLVPDIHDLSEDTDLRSGSLQAGADFPLSALPSDTSSINKSLSGHPGERVSTATEDTPRVGIVGTNSPSDSAGNLVTNIASTARKHTTDSIEQRLAENLREPTDLKKFEATTAEAELDDLLDLLDNQVAGISLKNVNEANFPRSSTSEAVSVLSSYSASSTPSSSAFQEPKIDYKPTAVIPEPIVRETSKSFLRFSYSATEVKKTDPKMDAKGADVLLSQDDDFDSWLDSI